MERFGFKTEHFLEPAEDDQRIRERMMHWIRHAEVCIADLTEQNANVFFEYGWRRALRLPVLALVEHGQKLLFDVDDYHTAPYSVDDPDQAIAAIESFLTRKGFGTPELQVSLERNAQTKDLCEFIIRNKPRRLEIMHLSLFTIVKDLIEALWQSPNTTVCLLLMKPSEAARYASKSGHTDDILWTESQIRRISLSAQHTGQPPPTVGLWYYDHEPSVASFVADDKLVQLGWYLRTPITRDSKVLRVAGHNQPSLLVLEDKALLLAPKIRTHFRGVWREATPAPDECFSGSGIEKLKAEWHLLKASA